MKTLVLANPAAGGRRGRLLPQVLDYLRSLGAKFDVLSTDSPTELEEAARQAAVEGVECVIAAGGDGTAHHAIQGLVGSEAALGLLPLGNGNDLARSLAIPADPLLACHVLVRGSTRQIDLARVRGPVNAYYACVGSVGFDAAVNRMANERRAFFRGPMLYLASAIRVLLRFEPIRLELSSDGGNFSGEAMLAVVANSASYGGGLRIAPEARLDDGRLDVLIVEGMSKFELLDTLPQLLRGTHTRKPAIRSWRASRVELRTPAGWDFFCDGEYLAQLPLTIEIAPLSVSVVAPVE